MRTTIKPTRSRKLVVEHLEKRVVLTADFSVPWDVLTEFEPSLASDNIDLSKLVTDGKRADKSFQHKRVKPALARDFNPDPDVFETVLVAIPRSMDLGTGAPVEMLTYNGLVPGPTINADVGDKIIVHYLNLAEQDTTIHWHGVEVPALMDGSNISQIPVPADGYFRYEFDLLTPSLFWYHPHFNTNELIERGLYGSLVANGPGENEMLGVDPRNEHILVLDDILLDDQGQIAPPFPDDPLENALTHVNGREGNQFLINGREDLRGLLERGVPHRMRIVNVANTRFMRLSIPGHTMYRVGGDAGLLESPIAIEPIGMVPDGAGGMMSDPDPSKGLLLTPGERADIVFVPTGKEVKLEWHDVARGKHSAFYAPDGSIGLGDAEDDGKRPSQTLMTFELFGHGSGEYQPPEELRDIEAIDYGGAEKLVYTFGHALPDAAGEVTFFAQLADGGPRPFPVLTPEQAYSVNVGDTRVIEVSNLTGGDHNVHLHGFVMQPIEIEFVDALNPDNNETVPFEQLENKDTVLIPRRPGARGSSRTILRLAVTFDDTGREGKVAASGKQPMETKSGGWLLHCHILEHADSGMMSFVQVLANDGAVEDTISLVSADTRLFRDDDPSESSPPSGVLVHGAGDVLQVDNKNDVRVDLPLNLPEVAKSPVADVLVQVPGKKRDQQDILEAFNLDAIDDVVDLLAAEQAD